MLEATGPRSVAAKSRLRPTTTSSAIPAATDRPKLLVVIPPLGIFFNPGEFNPFTSSSVGAHGEREYDPPTGEIGALGVPCEEPVVKERGAGREG